MNPKKGSIVLIMGSKERLSIVAALFTGTQRRALACCSVVPDRAFIPTKSCGSRSKGAVP